MSDSQYLRGWFDKCESVESLNRERSILISVINEEYGKKKKDILSKIPDFKRVSIITFADVEDPDIPVYTPFPVLPEKAPKNAIIFNKKGEVQI